MPGGELGADIPFKESELGGDDSFLGAGSWIGGDQSLIQQNDIPKLVLARKDSIVIEHESELSQKIILKEKELAELKSAMKRVDSDPMKEKELAGLKLTMKRVESDPTFPLPPGSINPVQAAGQNEAEFTLKKESRILKDFQNLGIDINPEKGNTDYINKALRKYGVNREKLFPTVPLNEMQKKLSQVDLQQKKLLENIGDDPDHHDLSNNEIYLDAP
jgi:hypothetical protein